MLNKIQTLKSLELENRRQPVGIKSIDFGVPIRGLLKFQVPIQIPTHTGFGSSLSSVHSLAGLWPQSCPLRDGIFA